MDGSPIRVGFRSLLRLLSLHKSLTWLHVTASSQPVIDTCIRLEASAQLLL
jgi:hypothetical protein